MLTHGNSPTSRDGGVEIYPQPPSGQSRVYRVAQMRTDGVHCQESAGTVVPVVLKVVPVNGASLSGVTIDQPFLCTSLFPYYPLLVCTGHDGMMTCGKQKVSERGGQQVVIVIMVGFYLLTPRRYNFHYGNQNNKRNNPVETRTQDTHYYSETAMISTTTSLTRLFCVINVNSSISAQYTVPVHCLYLPDLVKSLHITAGIFLFDGRPRLPLQTLNRLYTTCYYAQNLFSQLLRNISTVPR